MGFDIFVGLDSGYMSGYAHAHRGDAVFFLTASYQGVHGVNLSHINDVPFDQ